MSEDKGNSLDPFQAESPHPAEAALFEQPAGMPSYSAAAAMDDEEEGGGKFDILRYLHAIRRRAWLLPIGLIIGLGGAYWTWTNAEFEYLAEGSIWIEREQGTSVGDVAPIRLAGLFEDNAWIELLRSYSVMDPVVVEQRLYLTYDREHDPTFQDFELEERFLPGEYRLTLSEDGQTLTLTEKNGTPVDAGPIGEPLGEDIGIIWTPGPVGVAPGESIDFDLTTPRAAARELMTQLGSRMDSRGNFIRMSLRGPDNEKVASVLDAVMNQHVSVAAELKRSKLVESTEILEEQLIRAEATLSEAERALEEFRVGTITLPSDAATPIQPGLVTTTPQVVSNYFTMQTTLQTQRRDRIRIQTVLDSVLAGTVRIEALEAIPPVAASSEMGALLNELVTARAQLRLLRDRYQDTYEPIQMLLEQINNIETEAVPRLLTGVLREAQASENELASMVDSASAELAEIPPRTIEEARLGRQVGIQATLYNELRQRVETARLAAASSIPDVKILDPVAVPQFPMGDTRMVTALMFLLGGLGGAVAIALLLDQFDPRFRYPTEIGRKMGLDILGSIPRIKPDAQDDEEGAQQIVEAFRELRMTTGFAYGTAGPLLLTISSPSKGDGKSLVSANLAVAFAEVNQRTLLIDGDTRQGDVHRLLGVQRTPGLADYLRDRSSGNVIQATDYEHLDFIGSGTRGRSTPELMASSRMAMFIGTLKRAYDVIIIDSPPLAAGADPFVLASLTGHMAVVIRTGATEKALTVAKMEAMSRFPVRVLGAILNDVDTRSSSGYYYHSYLPGYEAQVEEGSPVEGTPLLTGAPEGD